MKKYLQKKLNNEKGMTLIELLAVIVIIAIIAAIAIPAIGNIIENSRVGAAKSDAQNVFSAAQLYLSDNDDAFGDANKTITKAELENEGYLEDLGGFDTSATPELVIKQNAAKEMTITGAAEIGGVKVVFTDATRATVSAAPNGLGNNPSGDAGSETFSVTDAGSVTVTR